MRSIAVAGLQMKVKPGADNTARAIHDVREMVRRFPWIELVLLSELAVSGMNRSDARPLPGPSEDAFAALAKELGIWLVPGSMYEAVGDKVYNTASVLDPSGGVVGRYRKMFPFNPYEPGVEAGEEPLIFDIPHVGRFGLSICYDMWFPEHTRWLVSHGVEVILHPTLTDTIDRDVEVAIVRATAAQNQVFVVDVNGVGAGGTGRSSIVGPAGDVLFTAGGDVQEMPIELNLDQVTRTRERGLRGLGQPLKSLRDRGFDFPHYAPGARSEYLDSLGPLVMPTRRSRGDGEPE